MESILIQCTHCSYAIKILEEIAGRKGRCPRCRGWITVPTWNELLEMAADVTPVREQEEQAQPADEEAVEAQPADEEAVEGQPADKEADSAAATHMSQEEVLRFLQLENEELEKMIQDRELGYSTMPGGKRAFERSEVEVIKSSKMTKMTTLIPREVKLGDATDIRLEELEQKVERLENKVERLYKMYMEKH